MRTENTSAYPGFTLGMAAVDTIPVVLFAAGSLAAWLWLRSPLFGAGALLCTIAGACKAAWKFVLALRRHDLPLLQKLFRLLMPAGFVLMGASIPFAPAAWARLARALLVMPSLLCWLLGCAGIALMVVFAVCANRHSARANWIEQLTNIAAQGFFLLALLLA